MDRGWHNQIKAVKSGSHGKCRICKKEVKNLELHMRDVHK